MLNTTIYNKYFAVVVFAISTISLNANDGAHSFYFISNSNISMDHSFYVNFSNPDYEAWSKPYNEFSFGGGYTYGLNDFLGVGLHVEGEQLKFDNFTIGANATALRYILGVHFETTYTKTPLHIISGFFFNLGKLKSNDFNFNVNGFEYGLYIGPELSIRQFGVSFLLRPKFSYFAGNNVNGILILNPDFSLKLNYNFRFDRKEK